MRLIDADKLKEVISDPLVLNKIDEQPTVDAVEIVRCRNCNRAFSTEDGLECLNDGSIVEENDYCLSGELRDGENG